MRTVQKASTASPGPRLRRACRRRSKNNLRYTAKAMGRKLKKGATASESNTGNGRAQPRTATELDDGPIIRSINARPRMAAERTFRYHTIRRSMQGKGPRKRSPPSAFPARRPELCGRGAVRQGRSRSQSSDPDQGRGVPTAGRGLRVSLRASPPAIPANHNVTPRFTTGENTCAHCSPTQPSLP